MPGRTTSILNRFVYPALDFLLFSNLFISLCAVAQGLVTYRLLKAEPDKYVLALLFFSTLAQYNVSIFQAKPAHPEQSEFRRVRWIFGHYRLMTSFTLVAVLCVLPLAFFLSAPAKILLIVLAAAGILYNIPLFSIGGNPFSLRNIPGIKLFMIAAVWAMSCVLLPILELESHRIFLSSEDTMLLLTKRFLLIAAITVPFDIRDLFHDKLHDLKTIPVIFGERKAYIFCQFLLIAYLVLLFIFNQKFDLNFAGLTLTVLVTGWLIFKSTVKRDEYYYFLYLDGIMILQYAMLVICNWI